MTHGLITLTTDFGLADPFVGIMKGVMLQINSRATIIDLSHNVPPQDVFCGALILRFAAQYFPKGTIHVGVVDPGVGSNRRPLLIETEDCSYIGPDNGLFSLAAKNKQITSMIELSNDAYFLKPTSATFHGRDLFAPIAAQLSLGVPAKEFGRPIDDFVAIDWPKPREVDGGLEGEVIYIDRFGNLITNISAEDLRGAAQGLTVSFKGHTLRGLVSSYLSGAQKQLMAIVDSWGLLEIARFRDSARVFSGAERGTKVLLHRDN